MKKTLSTVDGAAGGGLTPGAVIGSNATEGEIGATAHVTRTVTQDYLLPLLATTLALAIASASLMPLPAHAQSTAPASARSDALYKALGEKPGLVTLVDDFVNRLHADPRIGAHFKSTNLKNLKTQLTDQFCVVSGGPCVYEGDDMKTAHASLKITKGNFHALVEVLQQSMDGQGIAFATQNQLLALLAPMHRDVITVR